VALAGQRLAATGLLAYGLLLGRHPLFSTGRLFCAGSRRSIVPPAGGSLLQDGALKVLMQLACGGMSSINLVTTAQGERCVLKELAPQNANTETLTKVQELFGREARLLAKLDHPQIVELLDHFVDKGRNYIVLEYIAGLNLRQHVKVHGPFSEAEVLAIALQAADILMYLHSFNPAVIQRDFTPDNLVTREPDKAIVLIDFGAATESIGNASALLSASSLIFPPSNFGVKPAPRAICSAMERHNFICLQATIPNP
jgi:serine/threonine protein kinase